MPAPSTKAVPEASQVGETPALWRLLAEDFVAHGRDWSSPGFRALAVYRLGRWRRSKSGWVRKALYFPLRSLHRYVRNRYGIELFETATIGRRVRFLHYGGIVTHPHATLGDDCVLRHGVTIGASHDMTPAGAPVIGSSVQLGVGAVVIGRVTVGRGARIGPNAVVMQDVAPGAVVFAPAPRTIFAPAAPYVEDTGDRRGATGRPTDEAGA